MASPEKPADQQNHTHIRGQRPHPKFPRAYIMWGTGTEHPTIPKIVVLGIVTENGREPTTVEIPTKGTPPPSPPHHLPTTMIEGGSCFWKIMEEFTAAISSGSPLSPQEGGLVVIYSIYSVPQPHITNPIPPKRGTMHK